MKVTEKIFLILAAYSLGLPLGTIFSLFRLAGRIKVKGCLPVFEGGLILAYNHFSFLDPAFIPLLYFPRYLLNPFRFIPFGIPGKEDYYNKKWFLLFRPFSLPVKRKGGINKESLARMIEALKEKRKIAFPPEGGRTAKGEEFLYSKKRKRIRKLENGISLLAIRTEAKILPIWIEVDGPEFLVRDISFSEILRLLWQLYRESKIVIKIGNPFKVQAKTRREATQEIAEALLELADEE